MTSMKNAGRRLGLATAILCISTAAFADAGVKTHDIWSNAATFYPILIFLAGAFVAAMGAKGKDEAAARYLSVKLAVMMERFALECAHEINEWDAYQMTVGDLGNMITAIPELPEYPEAEEGWRALAPDLLDRAETLVSRVVAARFDMTSFTVLHLEDHDDIAERCAENAGHCGYEALVLARDLRRRYRLGAYDPTRNFWDIEPALKRRHDRVVARNLVSHPSYVFPRR